MDGERWQQALADEARAVLPAHVWRYFAAGARDEVSLAESLTTWSDVRLWPHVLRDVRSPSTQTSLLGAETPYPLGIAPTSLQRLAHPEGELAMARAAAATDTVLVVSSNAGTPFYEIGATGATWWLQAYLTTDRDLIAPTIAAAAAAGAGAVVLTLDTPVPGTKYDLEQAAFGDLTGVYGLNHPAAVRGRTPGAEHAQDITAADIAWLRDLAGVPVVAKGVLRPDDAERCVAAGAGAVWVSNHGGRQLDRAASSRAALPGIAARVGDTTEVYVDGGIRTGLDVVTALALGADAVFTGRLPLLALAAGGGDRVQQAIAALRAETVDALRLAGCPTWREARSLTRPDQPEALPGQP